MKIRKVLGNIKRFLLVCVDLPKSIYFNFRCFPLSLAIHIPIRVKWNTKVGKVYKGCIKISYCDLTPFMIVLGDRGCKFVSENKSSIYIMNNGVIEFHGKTIVGEGFNFWVDGGKLDIGENIYINRNLTIQCENRINIGNQCLLGWNINIRDTDGHIVYYNGKLRDCRAPIVIMKNVWIASDVTILKGTEISDNCIVACNSVVCGLKVDTKNQLIAGIPAGIKQGTIQWVE